MSLSYDDERPAGYQDADLELAEATAEADHDCMEYAEPYDERGQVTGAVCTSTDPANHQGETCPVHEGRLGHGWSCSRCGRLLQVG